MTKDAELIAELEAILADQSEPEGFYTTSEWAAMLGCSTRTAGIKLNAVHTAGRLAHAKVFRTSRNGRTQPTDAYRILPA